MCVASERVHRAGASKSSGQWHDKEAQRRSQQRETSQQPADKAADVCGATTGRRWAMVGDKGLAAGTHWPSWPSWPLLVDWTGLDAHPPGWPAVSAAARHWLHGTPRLEITMQSPDTLYSLYIVTSNGTMHFDYIDSVHRKNGYSVVRTAYSVVHVGSTSRATTIHHGQHGHNLSISISTYVHIHLYILPSSRVQSILHLSFPHFPMSSPETRPETELSSTRTTSVQPTIITKPTRLVLT